MEIHCWIALGSRIRLRRRLTRYVLYQALEGLSDDLVLEYDHKRSGNKLRNSNRLYPWIRKPCQFLFDRLSVRGGENGASHVPYICRIRPDIMGSDHCPVEADFHDTLLEYIENYKVASLCAKHLPEFSGSFSLTLDFLVITSCSGTQKKLKAFFSPKQSQDATTASSSHEVIDLTVDLPKRQSQLTMREFMFQPASVAQSSSAETKASAPSPAVSASWKSILSGKPPAPPNCPVHGVPSVLRTVLKTGKNWGKKFYVCSLPEGKPDDINARCNFFAWANNNKKRQRDD